MNTLGVVANIRAAARVMPQGARIISIGTGLATRVALPGTADYAASKAAVVAYSKDAARDLGARNITVNVVQPGLMPMEMAAASMGTIGPDPELPSFLAPMHAIPRFAQLQEVASAVVSLAGPNAAFITGAVLDVSGGFTV